MKIIRIAYICLLLLLFGCSQTQWAKYYLLDYVPPVLENDRLSESFNYSIQVQEFKIDRTYDNSRIVIRQSAHEVYYDRLSLWARRPPDAIASLITNHIKALNLVTNCRRTFLESRPDFIISGTIHNIEKYMSDIPQNEFLRADLSISLQMIDTKTDKIVVRHNFIRYTPLYTQSMSYFAKTLSDTLKNEISIFLRKVQEYFETIQQQPNPLQG